MKRKVGLWSLSVIILIILMPVGVVIYYKFDPELLAQLSFYIDLANPSMRIVKVQEGWRREEVAEALAQKLAWTPEEEGTFVTLALASANPEGHYFPKTYLIHKDEDPAEVRRIMFSEFSKNFEKIKNQKKSLSESSEFSEDTTLKIASIVQREAAGKRDMALISGILWNRINKRMKLQVDATLQYAKGSEENNWWPRVTGSDRKIKSPYNTYMHSGLPPSAISNPGEAALAAAYHPTKTDCLFFLHDRTKQIHCTRTYQAHEANVEKYLK